MFRNSNTERARHCPIWFAILAVIIALVATEPRVPAAGGGQPVVGQLLVATEEMKDPRFVESVIYIVKHDDEGTMGLVINRPIAQGPIDDLLRGFGAEAKGGTLEIIIHYGGPVSSRQGFLLHSDEVLLENSMKAKDGIAATSDTKMIQAIANGKGPRQFLFMLGYAGWAPGQLEGELKAKTWVVVSPDKSLIFGKDAGKKWRRAIDKRQISL
jgi:putative transcriptional regulator